MSHRCQPEHRLASLPLCSWPQDICLFNIIQAGTVAQGQNICLACRRPSLPSGWHLQAGGDVNDLPLPESLETTRLTWMGGRRFSLRLLLCSCGSPSLSESNSLQCMETDGRRGENQHLSVLPHAGQVGDVFPFPSALKPGY